MARSSTTLKRVLISYLKWLALVNDDLSSHPMMYGTEVRVSSCGREGVGKALSRLQYRRLLELIVGARHCGATLSWLVQVTVAPTGTAKVWGEKLKLSMATSVFVALEGADSLVSSFLPCVLLRNARATNMTNARVPVFTCLRNGDNTVTHLVVCF